MTFELATAGRVAFGRGVAAQAGPAAREFGTRALLVTGSGDGPSAPVRDSLEASGVAFVRMPLCGEPTVEDVATGADRVRQEGCDLVVACGGGSALDAGKAVAMLVANGGEALDYLEVVGRGRPITRDPMPLIAIPTTAGTGSEVTRNAVLASRAHGVKASLRSPRMLPRVALVDPALTDGLPPGTTASTGMDAFTQLLEPFVGLRANPLVDALCRDGMARAVRALRRAVADGSDTRARDDLALASLFGGLALAHAGLGAVHGLAAVVGGGFPAPHGAVCAALLAPVTRVNTEALRRRDPDGPGLRRYAEAACIVTGQPGAGPDDLVQALESLRADLGIPRLASWGVRPADVQALAEGALRASSTRNNPVVLTAGELVSCLVAEAA